MKSFSRSLERHLNRAPYRESRALSGHSGAVSWGKSTRQIQETGGPVLDLQLTWSVVDSKPLNISGPSFPDL